MSAKDLYNLFSPHMHNPPTFPHNNNTAVNVEIMKAQEEKLGMKATGIVRRIDDLGRVVVPKEIRRTLRIREGDPLEIFTDREGEIILKKYSPIGEMGTLAKQYAETLGKIIGNQVYITDLDQVIAASGGAKKEVIGKNLSQQLETLMNHREQAFHAGESKQYVPILEEEKEAAVAQAISTIICEGDVIGSVIIQAKEPGKKLEASDQKMVQVAAGFLGSQMEQ